MNESSPRLVIIGASTRSAAWSAFRAGYRPICVDAFADRDLRQVAEVIDAEYPGGIVAALSDVSATGWMFVGAMENHRFALRELQKLPRLGRYFGPPLPAIESLRDPLWLAERLRPLGCFPEIFSPLSPGGRGAGGEGDVFGVADETSSANSTRVIHQPPLPNPLPHGGEGTGKSQWRWLSKPLHGGGGLGVREAQASEASAAHYLQRYIPGTPMSALYRVTSTTSERLAVCEQLIGLPEAAAPGPFVFCGAISVPSITAEQAAQLDRIVETLISGLDYRGLIGIDLVWDSSQFWLIEINPRYTASTELWELTTHQSAVAAHIAAFDEHAPASSGLSPRPRPGGEGQGEGASAPNDARILSKAILYADRDLIAPNFDRFLLDRPTWSVPRIADVPATNSQIPTGAPICTVFAAGATPAACRCKLIRRLERVRAWFSPSVSERGT